VLQFFRSSVLQFICFYLLFFVFNFAAYAATSIDPSLKWYTIETDHFYIHYYTEEEAIAKRLAVIAEDVHNTISGILKHVSDQKVNIVLMDTYDYTVDFAMVFPDPKITIFLTAITSNSHPIHYENWLKYVLTHEYTHIIHLDTREGPAKGYGVVLGRAIFPNQYLPWFVIEGLATYMETAHTAGGRGNDARWDAWMRMDVLEDNMKSIDQVSVATTIKWPGGNAKYLYGVNFFQYLSTLYGEDLLARLNLEYAEYMFSYGIDPLFKSVYGGGLGDLWQEWIESMQKKYQKQKEEVEALGSTKFRLLTDSGEEKYNPEWSTDGQYIYYNYSTVDDTSQIKRVGVERKVEEEIVDGIIYDDDFFIEDDSIYYTKGAVYNNFYIYEDLYEYDLARRKDKRISHGLRLADPCLSPDKKNLVYAQNYLGTRSLWIDDLKGDRRELGKALEGDQYLAPEFSPDGRMIAAAKWIAGENRQDIYLIDTETGTEEPLFESSFLESNPAFSPDGKYIVFDSDMSGIVNLYAYELGTNKLYQVSNVLGIAQMPAVSPDGSKVAFSSYSSKGYDIAVIYFRPEEWREVDIPSLPLKQTLLYDLEDITSRESAAIKEIHPYRPFSHLMPKFWFPYTYYDENGLHALIYTAATDPVGENVVACQLGFDWGSYRPSYSLTLINNHFLPEIVLSASDVAVPYSWESTEYWQRQVGAGLFLSIRQNGVFNWYDNQAFSIGFEGIGFSNITSVESYTTKPDIGVVKGLALAWRYTSLKSYTASISPEDGINASARVVMFSPDLGSDYAFTRYSGGVSRYFQMP
ncbi:MAG: hypothetical protein KKH83_08375, partial [Candidatus Margulisbacteria bacterium]|nr:hypothetical protein [Candidatus Margulisiibacteriota bacterium]